MTTYLRKFFDDNLSRDSSDISKKFSKFNGKVTWYLFVYDPSHTSRDNLIAFKEVPPN